MPQYPGDPELLFEHITDLERGDDYTLSTARLGLHTGTHLDAPCHFLAGAPGLEAMPLDTTIGLVRVLGLEDAEIIQVEDLQIARIEPGERILFKTSNSSRLYADDSFRPDYVHLSPEGARYIAEVGLRLVGIDYLSIAGMENATKVHAILLSAGVWILEGINLAGVEPGNYALCCLPLPIFGRDGAPARALLLPSSHCLT